MKTIVMSAAVALALSTQLSLAQQVPSRTSQDQATASGDRNQAVATTDANAPAPARGANSFTEGQARSRIEAHGYSDVSGLSKDETGIWRGQARKGSQQAQVWVDYKGNVGQQ